MAHNDDTAATGDDAASAAAADAGNMDQLRSLLFGSQMRDYDERFRRLDERFSAEMESMGEALRTQAETLDAFIRSESDRWSAELHGERVARTEALQQTGAAIEQLRQELSARLDDLDAALGNETSARSGAIAALSSELREALETRAEAVERTLFQERDRLRDEKSGRDELAELFDELSARLRPASGPPG
jgi:LPS O-antigen subunit length determinant protein (WzzB/FepE family)